jgi:mannose-6-phosphate isomerase-like protein (cupin superfamily)
MRAWCETKDSYHMKVTKAIRHKKAWGWEDWIVNNSEYCGKILHFFKGAQFSMHFHSRKRETWYVLSGSLGLTVIDTKTAEKSFFRLTKGQVFTVDRLVPHQLFAHEESEVLEVSTPHYEDDSYRVEKGDSQK